MKDKFSFKVKESPISKLSDLSAVPKGTIEREVFVGMKFIAQVDKKFLSKT